MLILKLEKDYCVLLALLMEVDVKSEVYVMSSTLVKLIRFLTSLYVGSKSGIQVNINHYGCNQFNFKYLFSFPTPPVFSFLMDQR